MLCKANVDRIIKRTGYTYALLETKTGIPASSLRAYVSGKIDIPSKKLIALADVLCCSTDYLLGRVEITDAETDNWNTFRNELSRSIIEKEFAGQNIKALVLLNKYKRSDNEPIAVWPYNLLDAISSNILIPITKDQENGLKDALNALTGKEKDVLIKRFKNEKSLDEIAGEYQVTRERVRQMEAKALRKLRHPSRYKLIYYGRRGCGLKRRMDELDRIERKIEWKEAALNTRMEILKGDSDQIEEKLEKPIEDLGLSIRSYNCIKRADIRSIGELLEFMKDPDRDWKKIRNLGNKSIKDVKDCIKEYTGKSYRELTGKED